MQDGRDPCGQREISMGVRVWGEPLSFAKQGFEQSNEQQRCMLATRLPKP